LSRGRLWDAEHEDDDCGDEGDSFHRCSP
jgi:hypothetical protein